MENIEEYVMCPHCSDSVGSIDPNDIAGSGEILCETCQDERQISHEHQQLLDLGFRKSASAEYRLYLNKILNQIETINIELVRVDGKFEIAKINAGGSTNMIQNNSLDTVDDIIRFLS